EAAAETYFNTSAGQLNLAQASFLAGLPQSPAVHDIFTNRDDTLRRQKQVVLLMLEVSLARGRIVVSNSYLPVCVNGLEATQAVLPQSPAVHDIFTNRDDTLRRQKQVVLLMLEVSQARGCIYVSNSDQPVCVNEPEAIQAVQEIEAYNFQINRGDMRYPHWVN